MTSGQKVVAACEREVGEHEIPWGSNTGPRVLQYQRSTYLGGTGWAWCAAFVEFIYETTGVDHGKLIDPSTAVVFQRAKAAGALIDSPVPGAWILWPGIHIGIFTAPAWAGAWHTIEGNSADAVSRRIRTLRDDFVIVRPPGLTGEAVPTKVRLYYLEDPSARYELHPGRWRKRAYAEKVAKVWGGQVKETGDGRFVVRRGEPRVYGPWHDAAARDGRPGHRAEGARYVLEQRLGRDLRPYSELVDLTTTTAGVADDLGKTT